jgi:transposase
LSKNHEMPTQKHDPAVRIQALALVEEGITVKRVMEVTGLSRRTIFNLKKRARERGYDPAQSRTLKMEYVEDAPRSGRPKVITEEKRNQLVEEVRKNRDNREKSTAELGWLIGVSARSAHRILRQADMKKLKPSWKPGLTQEMREARLQFALRHKDWKLEDWKNVIWTDETSIVLGHRRGGNRVWRAPDERFHKTCVRVRWKKCSEFMFWGCFSYDWKGPMHIWKTETAAEKRKAKEEIDRLNQILEPHARRAWEEETTKRREKLRFPTRGRKPEWRFTAQTGKLERGNGKGIDWYRYQKVILREKLLPFAQECQKTRPYTIVQEDKAPSHASPLQEGVFKEFKVDRLLWPGNSPDLNAIEPCWNWLKRKTTRSGAPRYRILMEFKWREAWIGLEQKRIQAWIERIPRHIQEVIRLEGGNEYREGRAASAERRKKHRKGVY